MISTPFFHQKCAKWNTDDGDHGADGAPEMQPQAAAQIPVSRPDRARVSPSLYFGWLLLWLAGPVASLLLGLSTDRRSPKPT